jgi:outer membrane protein OmpA-like peptidoglycan-associated protein
VTLRDVAETLRTERERRVFIRGFTDSRGDETGNIGLSRRRAERVRDFLVSLGARRDQVEAEWRGEDNPLDTRDTPDAWSRNRRVEIIWRQ